jgi:Bcr/CflA subfamily drug resistance transporter
MQICRNINKSNKYLFAAIALFILPISGLSIDIYVPSLPAIAKFFVVNKKLAQLSVTMYMLGLGITQLIAGGITDSFGRKRPFLIAMAFYIAATLLIPASQTIYPLLILRFIQGMAVGFTVVPMRSIISDLFEGCEFYKMTNYMVMVWSIGPIIAPAIGSYLQQYFGWKMNFYFLAAYGLIGFILVWRCLPETSRFQYPFHLLAIYQRSVEMLKHNTFISSLIINGILYSIVILFAVTGPFLIQEVLHYSAIQFGRIALLVGLVWFMGTLANRFLSHITFEIKERILIILFIIAITMTFIASSIPMNIVTILMPILLLIFLAGILFPNYFARGMAIFPKTSGSANALFGASVFIIAGINSSLATFLKSTTQLPLALAYVGLISVCLIVRNIHRKNIYSAF